MKTIIKTVLCTTLLFSSFYSCTPPEDQTDSKHSSEIMSTGDDTSARPDNDRD